MAFNMELMTVLVFTITTFNRIRLMKDCMLYNLHTCMLAIKTGKYIMI